VNDFPYLAPPEDGLRRAMADARRRRYRTAGFSTSSVAAAALVLGALVGGQGTQSLVEQPAPQQPAVTQVVPDGGTSARNAPRPNQVQPGRVAGQSPVTGSAPVGTSAGTSRSETVGTSSHGSARPAAAAKPYSAGKITRSDSLGYLPGDYNCPVNGGAQTFCPYSSASSYSAGVYELFAEVCSTKAHDALLHFGQSNEVDFAVYKGSTLVWQWSRWHPARDAPHTATVTTGGCLSWTFDWTAVNFQGKKLPAGDYTLETTFLADELSGKEIMRRQFTVS
jgi:hypothetical protein